MAKGLEGKIWDMKKKMKDSKAEARKIVDEFEELQNTTPLTYAHHGALTELIASILQTCREEALEKAAKIVEESGIKDIFPVPRKVIASAIRALK